MPIIEKARKNLGELKKEEENLLSMMSALGDTNRFRIFKLLLRQPNLCVTEVAQVLNISVPATSQHFRILEMSGLVHKERSGLKVCYMLEREDPVVVSVAQLFKNK